MASVAVPFLFPPVLLGDEYYGDGAMRESNPFSAAIHLGANRLLVVLAAGAALGTSRPPWTAAPEDRVIAVCWLRHVVVMRLARRLPGDKP